MARPCESIHPQPEPGNCRLCYLYVNNPKYHDLWSGKSISQCKYLREQTGDQVRCKTCLGDTKVNTYFCSLHLICTTSHLIDKIKCCRLCTDRQV